MNKERHYLTSCCDVIIDVIDMQNIVFYIIWDVESESAIRFKLHWKLTKSVFTSGFRSRVDFFTGSATKNLLYQLDVQGFGLHFGFLNFAVAQKLTEISLFYSLGPLGRSWPWPLTCDLEHDIIKVPYHDITFLLFSLKCDELFVRN